MKDARFTLGTISIIMLMSLLLSLAPAALGPDMLVRQEHPISDNDVRIRLFRILVVPVVWLYDNIGVQGGYRFLVEPPEFADFAPRPSTMAFGHVLEATPVWTVCLCLCWWGVARLRSR